MAEQQQDPASADALTRDEAEDFAPAGADLVVRDPGDEQDVFVVLDRHDEELIIREFQRRALKVMLYDFPQDGNRVVDLSVQGVNEAIRLMNATGKCRIRVSPGSLAIEEFVEDGEPWIRATVYAEDGATGYGQYGTAVAPKRMKLKARTAKRYRDEGKPVGDDDTVWDRFAATKAINKAQRNALAMHIPEGMRQTLIAQYRGDAEAVRVIQAGAGAAAEAALPPPLDDERARELKAQIREVYDEIREVSRLALLPGAFHVRFSRTQHDHKLMEEFLVYLQGLLKHAREQAEQAA